MNDAVPPLSVVMPAYREGQAIGPVLRSLAAQVRTPHEILVVCDAASDPTVPVVEALRSELPSLRLALNARGRGVLGAMRTGMDLAQGDLILVTMADGSDEYDRVDEMVALARGGAAVVAASRYMPGGLQLGAPRLKSFLSRSAGLLLHHLGGVPIHDATSNFKLYRRDFLAATPIESRGSFELAIELVVKAHRRGLPLAEVPTTWRERTQGTSHFDLGGTLHRYLRWFLLGLLTRVRRGA